MTKRDAHTNTHTSQHLSQEWQGAAETRGLAHTPTPHTRAGNDGVQAKRAHNHTRPKHPSQERWGASQSPSPTAYTTNPSREWRGETTTRTQKHPPKTPAKVQPGPKHKRQMTVGTPVSIGRALTQPVPCR